MSDAGDRIAILDLYARYNAAIDSGDIDGWCDSFIDEGVFDHPARCWEGREALREFVAARTDGFDKAPLRAMRHWNDAIAIELDGDAATARCDLLVAGTSRTTGNPAVAATGHYQDRLVRTDGGWRFASRKLVLN